VSDTTIETEPVQRPVGRAAVIDAALHAAADLFADNNYSQVSVREIARRAGVSHALVHRYLGYKEDIFQAVLEWERKQAADYWASLTDANALPSPTDPGFRMDRYLRTILRARIEGLPVELTGDDIEASRRLLTMLRERAATLSFDEISLDARYVLLAVATASTAYSLAPEFFRSIAQLDGEDASVVDAEFFQVLQRFLTMPHVTLE